MIRIDEIYNNIFWPWIEANGLSTRMLFCDPPGSTDPEHLFTRVPQGLYEKDYIYLHDQEPVDIDLHSALFDRAAQLGTQGLGWGRVRDQFVQLQQPAAKTGHIIVSEQGQFVDEVCDHYGWQAHYYFYHGWAALDWYRGYDRTYQIARAQLRRPTQTFISPNRIVAGQRDHRVLFLYNIFKNQLANNYISAPRICPYEGLDIASIAQKYTDVYPDIVDVINQAELPRLFEGETEQLMSSYELTNFKEAQDSLIYVATETVYAGRRQHLTEKTFRAIALEMPFILVAPQHSLKYLQSYGFKTFSPYIDESYDAVEDPIGRLEMVTQILQGIQARSAAARQELWQQLLPAVEYNYHHFYSGGFEQILWLELEQMLAGIKQYV